MKSARGTERLVLLFLLPSVIALAVAPAMFAQSSNVSVFATGFNNPRGLKFGPDGYLYVAEGGVGGTTLSTTCAQVVSPVGPYTGSDNGSCISRVNLAGERTTFLDHLPSDQTSPLQG